MCTHWASRAPDARGYALERVAYFCADFVRRGDSTSRYCRSARPTPKLPNREVQVLCARDVVRLRREAAERHFMTEAAVSTHLAGIKTKYSVLGRPAVRTKVAIFVRVVQDGHGTFDECQPHQPCRGDHQGVRPNHDRHETKSEPTRGQMCKNLNIAITVTQRHRDDLRRRATIQSVHFGVFTELM